MTAEQPIPTKHIKISHWLSNSAVRVFPCRRDEAGNPIRRAQGTGCIWQDDATAYLITNWHIATGWDPIRDHAIDSSGFTPDCLEFVVRLAKDIGGGLIQPDTRRAVVDLLDEHGEPTWLEHPSFGRNVDVVALEFADLDHKLLTQPINTYDDYVNFDPAVGDDVFILGFPLGLDGGAGFPIWKRGSIASEPDIDIDGLPKILIDSATRKGMSGSPVIAVRRGMTRPKGSTNIGDAVIGASEAFLGIYSGRVDDDPLGAQIGIVWKSSVVGEIVRGKTRGKALFNMR